jgi:CRP/FNR family cyclic AMP-dependent transcriptional regulator
LNDFWHVGRIDWLRGLPEERQEDLRSSAKSVTYRPGEMIFLPERQPAFVYVLTSGLVRIFRLSPSGNEVQFGHVLPGEIFGELELFVDRPRESFAQAVERSTALKITRENFQLVIKSSPSVMFEVSRQMGGRFKKIEGRVEDLVFRSALSRVARILLQLAKEFPGDRGTSIGLPLTQSEIAVMIGASRQTVNLCLSQLREEQVLDYEGQRFALLDRDRLEHIADQREI